jgi:hypothetical protein
MWPVAFALKELARGEEARIVALEKSGQCLTLTAAMIRR